MRITAKDQILQLKTDKKLVVQLTKRLEKSQAKEASWKAKYEQISGVLDDVKISLNSEGLSNNYATFEYGKSTGALSIEWFSKDQAIQLSEERTQELLDYLMEQVNPVVEEEEEAVAAQL